MASTSNEDSVDGAVTTSLDENIDDQNEFPELLKSVGLIIREELDEDATTEEDTQELSRESRKRKANRIPRIYKSDMRRQYSTMLVNVFQSSDFSTILSFFKTFSTDAMIVKMKGVGQSLVPKNINYFQENRKSSDITFSGQDWVRFHFFSMHCMTCDHIYEVKNAKIVAKRHSKRSAIVMDTVISFTQFYDATPFQVVDELFATRTNPVKKIYQDACDFDEILTADSESAVSTSVDKNQEDFSSEPTSPSIRTTTSSVIEIAAPMSTRCTRDYLRSKQEMENIPDVRDIFRASTGQEVPLLSTPRAISFPSRLVIFLDENKYIETMVFGTDEVVEIPHTQFHNVSVES